MKKNVVCLMAVTVIMITGCKKQNPQPGSKPIPVVEDTYKYLGRGYDATAHYAMDEDVKAPVLSQTLLGAYEFVDIKTPLTMQKSATFGKNLQEYEEKITQKLSIKGGAWGFSGSLNETFTKDAVSTKENSFYSDRYSKEMKMYSIVSNATIDQLMYCLTPDFTSDVTSGKYSAKQLVDMYGTHVIAGFSMGGRMEFNLSVMNETNLTESDFSIFASAGYEGIIGKLDQSTAEYTKYQEFKSQHYNYSEKFFCRGGNSGEIFFEGNRENRRAIYSAWDASLDDENNQVLVEFAKDRGLIPLNEFIRDATLASQVEDEIKNRLNNPVEQNTAYRQFQLYFKRVDTKNYKDGYGYLKWIMTMSVKPNGAESCYLFNTQTKDANIPGGGLVYLYTDAGDCQCKGHYPGINFKRQIVGAHSTSYQKDALKWGEPVSMRYDLNRWAKNEVEITVDTLIQHYAAQTDDKMKPIKVKMTCLPNSDIWSYNKGNDIIEVPDRRSSTQMGDEYDPTEIILTGSSELGYHKGEYINLILEYEWK